MFSGKILKGINYVDGRSKIISFELTDEVKDYLGDNTYLEQKYTQFMMDNGGFNHNNSYYSVQEISDEKKAELVGLDVDIVTSYKERLFEIRMLVSTAVEVVVKKLFNKNPDSYNLPVSYHIPDNENINVVITNSNFSKEELNYLANVLEKVV